MWIGLAVVHSLSLFFLTYFYLEEQIVWASGHDGGWLMMGNSAYTVVFTIDFILLTLFFSSL